ncbi:hypothetical protein [Methanolacinia petrolearia]|uniref:hypothetical protein n=1 Tax=Methanolacinia petrolearia TaxID=54120 RepID=UPI003BAC0B12
MDPRTLDIAAFIAALCIVAAITFMVNSTAGEDDKAGVNTSVPGATAEVSLADNASGGLTLQYGLPSYLTKAERNWLISRQVSQGMDYYLPATRDYAVRYIPSDHAGTFTIEQACDIRDGSVADWTYSGEDGGLLDISSASRSINTGLTGDEADFAVFLASMIKGAGGEARIKSGVDPESGEYAVAKLYLGNSEDYNTKIISPEKYEAFKSNYSAIFEKDPSGLTIFKYRYGTLCSGDTCYSFMDPFMQIMNEPEKYGEICYTYPKLINYLLLFPDTNAIDFQALYIQVRYGGYDDRYKETRDIRNLNYDYYVEENGGVTYWLPLELFGEYPGDTGYSDAGSAMVYYSDGLYKSVRVNEKVAPIIG